MKPRNREINIFNMSLLDILCGALGAFCFLMLALFPYYAKGSGAQTQEDTTKLKQELEQARKELEQAKSKVPTAADSSEQLAKENQDLKKQLADARRQLDNAKTAKVETKPGEEKQVQQRLENLASRAGSVLVITAYWESANADVDLWVKDQSGGWDGPKKETPDGKKLNYQIRDTNQGPGYEEFHDSGAGGRYEVYYRLTNKTGTPGTPVPVMAHVSWLGVGEKGSSLRHSGWSRNSLNEERRLVPAFVVLVEKGQMRVQAFGPQR
jgi:hypothetical protein